MRTAATKSDWQTLPFPKSIKELPCHRQFSDRQMQKVKLGLLPNAMEDKWFIYFEDNTLNIHRSWTGLKVYQVIFHFTNDKTETTRAYVNNDPAEYTPQSDDYETKMISFLIDRFLLEKAVPFPTH
jgi:hypothetical protein